MTTPVRETRRQRDERLLAEYRAEVAAYWERFWAWAGRAAEVWTDEALGGDAAVPNVDPELVDAIGQTIRTEMRAASDRLIDRLRRAALETAPPAAGR
jgi:hypothetical protein